MRQACTKLKKGEHDLDSFRIAASKVIRDVCLKTKGKPKCTQLLDEGKKKWKGLVSYTLPPQSDLNTFTKPRV